MRRSVFCQAHTYSFTGSNSVVRSCGVWWSLGGASDCGCFCEGNRGVGVGRDFEICVDIYQRTNPGLVANRRGVQLTPASSGLISKRASSADGVQSLIQHSLLPFIAFVWHRLGISLFFETIYGRV